MDRQYWLSRLWWAEYFANRTVDMNVYRRFEVMRQEACEKLGLLDYTK